MVLAVASVVPRGTALEAVAPAHPRSFHDVDGDGRADVIIYRPANGDWWIRHSTGVGEIPVGSRCVLDNTAEHDSSEPGIEPPCGFRL